MKNDSRSNEASRDDSSRDSPSCPVTDALRSSRYTGLTRVQCEFRAGQATLQGEVSSFYLKQLAQEIAKRVQGVEVVQNRLTVSLAET